MSANVRANMHTIVERLDPSFRDVGERDIKAIEEAGARSVKDLLAILQDGHASSELRAAVCWVLGRLGRRSAVPGLLMALKDSDPKVRQAAAQALGDSADKRAAKPLGQVLASDGSVEVRKAAAYALGLIGEADGLEPLVRSLSNRQEDTSVRGMAAEALAGVGTHDAVNALVTALDDPSVEVRYWASFALGEIGDPAALPHLERVAASDHAMLGDHGTVAAEAAESIEQIRSRMDRAD